MYTPLHKNAGNASSKENADNSNSNNSVTENIKDPVFKAILKYKNYPSVLAIQKYSKNKTFHFEQVNIREVQKEILKLDKAKASQKTDIPSGIIKENIDIFADFLCSSINSTISFTSSLKLAGVTPVHKKGRKDMKENFRPVSIWPTLSKIYEKCIVAKMSSFFDSIFSNQQCSFRRGYSTQHSVHPPPPSFLQRGVEPPTKFSKRGA